MGSQGWSEAFFYANTMEINILDYGEK